MKRAYALCVEDNPFSLNNTVTLLLSQGWELWGNPVIYQNKEHGILDICFGQALVKFEEEVENTGTFKHTLTDKPATGFVVGTPSMIEIAEPTISFRPVIHPLPTPADFRQLNVAMINSLIDGAGDE